MACLAVCLLGLASAIGLFAPSYTSAEGLPVSTLLSLLPLYLRIPLMPGLSLNLLLDVFALSVGRSSGGSWSFLPPQLEPTHDLFRSLHSLPKPRRRLVLPDARIRAKSTFIVSNQPSELVQQAEMGICSAPPGGRYAELWPLRVQNSEKVIWAGILMLVLTASILAGGILLLHLYHKTTQASNGLRGKVKDGKRTGREQTLALMLIVDIT